MLAHNKDDLFHVILERHYVLIFISYVNGTMDYVALLSLPND